MIRLFSTAPQSADSTDGAAYLRELQRVARWSEGIDCEGILVYTDNRLVDPWLVSQTIIQSTERLCPLVATQPVYMHPYSVAKLVSSLYYLYGRRIHLNMVAGGFRNDLLAMGDPTPHDLRYERLLEYVKVIKELLANNRPVSFTGRFYAIDRLQLRPPVPVAFLPGILLSGSSDAGRAAAAALEAVPIEYPGPTEDYAKPERRRTNTGIRIGIIADADRDRAWDVAYRRFPIDAKGQLAHKLTMKVSDSSWHKQLAEMGSADGSGPSLYWLWPFKNYQTFCPYLVGGLDEVAEEVSKYLRAGFDHFILDIPREEQDLITAREVFDHAQEMAGVGG